MEKEYIKVLDRTNGKPGTLTAAAYKQVCSEVCTVNGKEVERYEVLSNKALAKKLKPKKKATA